MTKSPLSKPAGMNEYEYPSDRFHEAFKEAIASTGMTPAQIARSWSAETDKAPLAMQMTLGRWTKELPKTIIDLVSLLDALDFEIIIQRRRMIK